MSICVKKFGGSSVGSKERIAAVADRVIASKSDGNQVVVVVSAMGDTTDHLVEMARELSNGNPSPREYDALVSTGENVSAALLSMNLNAKGCPAISLSGPQAGVMTEAIHSKAKILNVNPSRVKEELDKGNVVVITGFQGISPQNDITTIGRGGSDTSAVVMAAALGLDECEIYTDVDGIYTTDPRIEEKARKMKEVSYEEMLELASLGAKVLHPRAVECAKQNEIVLHVRSSFSTDEGTRVKESKSMEIEKAVTGVALKKNEAKLSILGVSDKPGTAAKVFQKLADGYVNVDMIVQATEQDGSNNISFTVDKDDLKKTEEILQDIAKEIGASGIKSQDDICKISIVGVGMVSRVGVAAKMFTELGEAGINIHLISTSEIKVSCAIDAKDGETAVRVLHSALELA